MSVDRAASFVEYARKYAGLKWALTPCKGKDPFETGWQKTKPDLPDLAAGKWAHSGKRWNLGVVCGPSGLAVLDVDRDDDPDARCLELLGIDVLPETPIVRTGRGRLQVYFRDPGGLVKRAKDGFELRVGEHQCVAPPSVHPDTGEVYEWLPGRAPWDVPLAELPAHLPDWFGSSKNGAAPPVGETIPEGSRNAELASLAGTMRHRGMGEAEILAALNVANTKRCRPPLPAAEVEKIAASIAGYKPAAREAPAKQDDGPRLLATIRGDLIEMRSIEWLDKPLLQGSAFHLVAGPKGVGKGTWIARIVAAMTQGSYGTPRNVLIVSSEDSASIDLKPRLVAAGADHTRWTLIVEENILLPRDLFRLEDLAAATTDVGLIVVDPIGNHMGGADTDKESAVRHAISGLNKIADELACVVLGVRHIGKFRQNGALASVLGSTAWVDLPRAVLAFAPDDEDAMIFHVQVVAGNRSGRTAAESYRIELRDVGLKEPVTYAVALGESLKNVDELLAGPRRASKSQSARGLILDILEAEGEQESDTLDARVAKETGLTAKTVQNQRGELKNAGLIRSVARKGDDGGVDHWKVVRTGAPRETPR